MRTIVVIVACTVMLCACDHSTPATQAVNASASAATAKSTHQTSPDSIALPRYDGYGDLRFGMPEAVAEHAWGGELKGAAMPGSSCVTKRPLWVKHPGDFSMMFDGGRFVRYDVGTAKEVAPGGGRVGMSTPQILALYPSSVETQPHKYVAGAKYLRINAPHGGSGNSTLLVFETDSLGKITRWRIGVPPQIDYVEGCA